MKENLKEMHEMELKIFIIEYNKASQIDRSFGKTLKPKIKEQFREELLAACLYLIKKVDDSTIDNTLIRKKIKDLTKIDKNISYGQAQKVINLCLKQYCFITKKNEKILHELDCPLDITTMKHCGIKNKNMKNVNEEDYLNYQKKFEEDHNGLRILRDIIYDKERIAGFLL